MKYQIKNERGWWERNILTWIYAFTHNFYIRLTTKIIIIIMFVKFLLFFILRSEKKNYQRRSIYVNVKKN